MKTTTALWRRVHLLHFKRIQHFGKYANLLFVAEGDENIDAAVIIVC